MTILFINGPNLNMLGKREPDIYGAATLPAIEKKCQDYLFAAGKTASFFQSNAEHEIIDRVQLAPSQGIDFIIINPAAFTHTSVAIRDALAAVEIPFIEVHLSNPHAREAFRRHSYFSDLALGVIAGFGENSYLMACDAALKSLSENQL